VNVGGTVSETTTLKTHDDSSPALSVAEHVTRVVPNTNGVADCGTHPELARPALSTAEKLHEGVALAEFPFVGEIEYGLAVV
jgi:hypothetical protein